ncbi:MAG TPA: HIT family protein [Methanothermococcus okinawensis]|uniref:HIT family protein n=1 Tax=Methanothermococcus okinawensis TaxID=155863 RepID=A0A832ZR80_9EURY|nr:HIT family protein [Methanothermococcus okinawensis]HIP90998.1 HIT family protein [Methanothermococcus okinawensis]
MCIFCKIVKKEIPAKILYEDEKTMAFLDINPRSKGHTLVIPKEHYETFEEVPEDVALHLVKTIKKVLEILKPLNYHGYNILSNNKPAAGQEVPHLHFHIIPRYRGEKEDVVKLAPPIEVDLDKVLEELKGKKS